MSTHWSIPGVSLDFQLGPLFLAHCFNWGLYGLLLLQVYIYYCSFVNDPRGHKGLVYIVFVLDTASIACSTYSGYWVFVTNWGNVAVFNGLGWSWASVPASTGLIALIVQTFYAYRVWRVSQKTNWYIPLFIMLLSGVSCGFSFAAANQVAHLQSFTYIRLLIPSIWLSFGIAADFVCCAALIYYFTITKVRYTLTNRIMLRLVRIVVETAVVTIVAASIKMFLIFSRHDNMHLLFCLLLPRLYSNALMGSLNSRSSVFGGDQVRAKARRDDLRISSPGTSFSSWLEKKRSPTTTSPLASNVNTEVETGQIGDYTTQILQYQPMHSVPMQSPGLLASPLPIHHPHNSPLITFSAPPTPSLRGPTL